MSTAYQRLSALRDRAVEVRDSLPIGSVQGEFYTDYIAALEEAILEVTTAQPEPDEKEETKALTMPERFDYDAFLLDLMLPRNQMRVWDAAGIWS